MVDPAVLVAHVDGDVLLVGIALAFVSQTVIGWMKLTSLEGSVKGLRADMKEMQDLHPRQQNPGHREHAKGDQHPEERG